jgi:ubiquitin-protein ligase
MWELKMVNVSGDDVRYSFVDTNDTTFEQGVWHIDVSESGLYVSPPIVDEATKFIRLPVAHVRVCLGHLNVVELVHALKKKRAEC